MPKKIKAMTIDVDDTLVDFGEKTAKLKDANQLLPILLFAKQNGIELGLVSNRSKSLDEDTQNSAIKIADLIRRLEDIGIFINKEQVYYREGPLYANGKFAYENARRNAFVEKTKPLMRQTYNIDDPNELNLGIQEFVNSKSIQIATIASDLKITDPAELLHLDDSANYVKEVAAKGFATVKARDPKEVNYQYLTELAESIGLKSYADLLFQHPEQYKSDPPLKKTSAVLYLLNYNPKFFDDASNREKMTALLGELRAEDAKKFLAMLHHNNNLDQKDAPKKTILLDLLSDQSINQAAKNKLIFIHQLLLEKTDLPSEQKEGYVKEIQPFLSLPMRISLTFNKIINTAAQLIARVFPAASEGDKQALNPQKIQAMKANNYYNNSALKQAYDNYIASKHNLNKQRKGYRETKNADLKKQFASNIANLEEDTKKYASELQQAYTAATARIDSGVSSSKTEIKPKNSYNLMGMAMAKLPKLRRKARQKKTANEEPKDKIGALENKGLISRIIHKAKKNTLHSNKKMENIAQPNAVASSDYQIKIINDYDYNRAEFILKSGESRQLEQQGLKISIQDGKVNIRCFDSEKANCSIVVTPPNDKEMTIMIDKGELGILNQNDERIQFTSEVRPSPKL